MIPVARAEIAPATTGSWQDVDLTAYLGDDAGDVAGVLLETSQNVTYDRNGNARKNGSSDSFTYYFSSKEHSYMAVGIDGDDIIELNRAHTDFRFWLVGYFKNSEAAFFTNWLIKTPSQIGWLDIDISGDTEANTATCAWTSARSTQYLKHFTIAQRCNGSTDDRTRILVNSHMASYATPVDGSEIFEFYISDVTDIQYFVLYLAGYSMSNINGWANAKDYSTGSTLSWNDTDMSGDIPEGNDGALVHLWPTVDAAKSYGLRKNGDEYDNYRYVMKHTHAWVALDSGRVCEQKVNSLDADLFLLAYTSQPAAPPPAVKAIVQAALISIPPLIVLPTLAQILKLTGGC